MTREWDVSPTTALLNTAHLLFTSATCVIDLLFTSPTCVIDLLFTSATCVICDTEAKMPTIRKTMKTINTVKPLNNIFGPRPQTIKQEIRVHIPCG